MDDLRSAPDDVLGSVVPVRATDRKVLALHDRCPQASTPREACRLLGIDFYEYMAAAA